MKQLLYVNAVLPIIGCQIFFSIMRPTSIFIFSPLLPLSLALSFFFSFLSGFSEFSQVWWSFCLLNLQKIYTHL